MFDHTTLIFRPGETSISLASRVSEEEINKQQLPLQDRVEMELESMKRKLENIDIQIKKIKHH